MEKLPLLPGFSFRDIEKQHFQLVQQFDFKNGYPVPKQSNCGVGKEPLDVNSTLFRKNFTGSNIIDPKLIYGQRKQSPMAKFQPHSVEYDKKCLLFRGFFQQIVPEPSREQTRIRIVNIIYFLEDDTLTVVEPPIHNSGLTQGKIVRRDRIPMENTGKFWHWKDLNVDIDVKFYGITYHICNCDAFTKEYLLSQGIELNNELELPVDPYFRGKEEITKMIHKQNETEKDAKFRQYLEFDGKVLRFYAVWYNKNNDVDEKRLCRLYYYLSDDKMEIIESRDTNSGRDPFPRILNKMRVPKNWQILADIYPPSTPDLSRSNPETYYSPLDFQIGKTLVILKKKFFLYDCDPFTRNFYLKYLNIDQGPPMKAIETEKRLKISVITPPHIGIGQPEDTLLSCLTLRPVPQKKNMIPYLMNVGKVLRYSAKLDWIHPEDENREFVIQYSLAEGFVSITEKRVKNSGFDGGRYLKPMLLRRPDSDPNDPQYYTPRDFRLGSKVYVYGQRFIVTGVDLSVLRYMEANPEKFQPDHIEEFRNYFLKQGISISKDESSDKKEPAAVKPLN